MHSNKAEKDCDRCVDRQEYAGYRPRSRPNQGGQNKTDNGHASHNDPRGPTKPQGHDQERRQRPNDGSGQSRKPIREEKVAIEVRSGVEAHRKRKRKDRPVRWRLWIWFLDHC